MIDDSLIKKSYYSARLLNYDGLKIRNNIILTDIKFVENTFKALQHKEFDSISNVIYRKASTSETNKIYIQDNLSIKKIKKYFLKNEEKFQPEALKDNTLHALVKEKKDLLYKMIDERTQGNPSQKSDANSHVSLLNIKRVIQTMSPLNQK